LIALSVTGLASGRTGSTATDTHLPSGPSGRPSRLMRIIPTTARSSPLW
jgi:hypothetical protein